MQAEPDAQIGAQGAKGGRHRRGKKAVEAEQGQRDKDKQSARGADEVARQRGEQSGVQREARGAAPLGMEVGRQPLAVHCEVQRSE